MASGLYFGIFVRDEPVLYRILHSIDRRAVFLSVVLYIWIKLATLKLKEAGSWRIIGDGERVLKTGGAEPLVIHFIP